MDLLESEHLSARARSALQAYIDLIRRMTAELGELPLAEQIKSGIEISG